MSKETNYIDDYFKDGLGNVDMVPPAGVWENIEKELDRKRRFGLFAIWTGLAAGLALFIGVGSYYFFDSKQNNPIIAKVEKRHEPNHEKTDFLAKENSMLVPPAQKSVSIKVSEKQSAIIHSSTTDIDIGNQSESNISKKTNQDSDGKQAIAMNNFGSANLGSANEVSGNRVSSPAGNFSGKEKVYIIVPKSIRFSIVSDPPPIIPVFPVTDNQNITNPNLLAYSDFVDPEPQKINRWSIEGQVAPQYSYRTISGVSSGSLTKSQFNSQEDGLVAYAGGIKVSYETSSRLSIQIGLVYSVIGQTLKDVYSVSQSFASKGDNILSTNALPFWASNSLGPISNHSSSGGDATFAKSVAADFASYNSLVNSNYTPEVLANANKIDIQLIQQQSYIEIPLLARYILVDKKVGMHLVGGISTNVLVDNNVFAKTGNSKENIGETGNLRTINYNGNVGFGINYKLWKKAMLTIEPTFKYYLNSITDKAEITYHPYSFGIYTGIRYKF